MNSTDQYSEGFAENNGVKIFYRDYGPVHGDPILMVHGLGAQLVHWPPHLVNFLQSHNFRPISAQYPKKVKSFTLIASTASTPSPINAPSKPVRELMMERSKNSNASAEEVIKREIKIVSLIGMKGRVVDTPEFRAETIKNLNRAQDGSGYARQLLSILASKDRLKKIQKIEAPTLIIHGKQDPMIQIKNAYKMHKLIPHSKLKIIEEMRHLIEPEILLQFEEDLLAHLRLAS